VLQITVLKIGDEAPAITALDQFGEARTLDELLSGGQLVLYFYPKDFTLVCTKQACAFRDDFESLAASGANVAGVSFDAVESHKKFSDAHNLPFPLLDDAGKRIARDYDVMGFFKMFPKRVTYVIGPDRRIRGVFHSELSANKHLQAVRSVLAG
jgi:peroxiredoxin Q/BCP